MWQRAIGRALPIDGDRFRLSGAGRRLSLVLAHNKAVGLFLDPRRKAGGKSTSDAFAVRVS